MLFADLEATLAEQERSELDTEVAERTRVEIGKIGLTERLLAASGAQIRIQALGGLTLAGQLRAVGSDWLLIEDEFRREHLVSTGALSLIDNLSLSAGPPRTAARQRIFERLDRRHAMRGIARDRAAVQIWLNDATTVMGTIDRVGADWLDLTELPAGEFRRSTHRTNIKTVPLRAVVCVRS